MNAEQAQMIEKVADGVMDVLEIGFKRLSEDAVLPTKAHASDSGFDIYAAESRLIRAGETVIIPTHLAVKLPVGYEAQIRPRSGITSRTTLRVQLGTIDNGYTGELGVICDNIAVPNDDIEGDMLLINESPSKQYVANYFVEKGDKIAQLVVQPIPQTVAVEITDIGEGERGGNGFGSSGV